MKAKELLKDMERNMEGVGTIHVPYHISQIKEALEELDSLESENKELRAEKERMRKALLHIRSYEEVGPNKDDGICPYGCDCPGIAKDLLQALAKES